MGGEGGGTFQKQTDPVKRRLGVTGAPEGLRKRL